jgi:hypothetical protein
MANTPSFNGLYYDYTSISCNLLNDQITGNFTSVTWDPQVSYGTLQGFGDRDVGTTPGRLSVKGTISLYREAYARVLSQLGPGWSRRLLNIGFTFYNVGNVPFQMDWLGARLMPGSGSINSNETGGNIVQLMVYIGQFLENGISPVGSF